MKTQRKKTGDFLSKRVGFRNFKSFVFLTYHGEKKLSLDKCASILGVSKPKIVGLMREHNFRTRTIKEAFYGKKPKRKRSMFLWEKTRRNTPFIFPWCAMYFYYNKCKLTTYELARVLKISQFSVCKMMRKYNIKRRKRGRYCE